ncbi:MAG: Serine hydroxymethyltransferase [Firmicutes bacterium ADurb.Bin300]|jgi:glycine hydroxymethyltransferase|nr:MAG: Serine hydroxymethyltransferase [Firmicutes bacterium ADurb.Bin300]HOD02962.1 serine hydroxymethyltransferase [Clostridiales bacterium]
MTDCLSLLTSFDPQIAEAIELETMRQKRNIELIASENYASAAVMAVSGSVLTNKYAEGYPSKRYYGGCECVDIVETLAIERAKQLFGANFANVQAHSGSQANFAVYFALLNLGDKVLGMSLSDGGHLTHGSPVNVSGKYFDFIPYGVDENGYLDYKELEKKAISEKPKMIVAGASAYPRFIDFERIADICKQVGALFMVDMAHIAGLVACGLHPSPIPYADIVTTTTHKTLRGPRGGLILTNNEEIATKINKSIFPGIQGGPLMHIIAAKAVCFGEALKPEFKQYSKKVLSNCKALENALKARGVNIVSGGSDNHLLLLDLRSLNITGKELEVRLDKVYITANKNAIPKDPEKVFITSGIRVGTPAVTTRGFGESEMGKIAEFIKLTATDFDNSTDYIRSEVTKICDKFPIYDF